MSPIHWKHHVALRRLEGELNRFHARFVLIRPQQEKSCEHRHRYARQHPGRLRPAPVGRRHRCCRHVLSNDGARVGDVTQSILGRTGAPASERPFEAAIIGLVIVGLVGFIPMVGGVIAFIGFGAVMLLAWRVLRQAPATASGGVGRRVVEPAS